MSCPVCGATITPDVDGKPTTQHDQEAHERRRLEDWAKRPVQRERLPKPGLYDPPGDLNLPSFVRSLIERAPHLKESIIEEYEAGMRGELLKPEKPAQTALPLPKVEPELQRPRRPPFGYED